MFNHFKVPRGHEDSFPGHDNNRRVQKKGGQTKAFGFTVSWAKRHCCRGGWAHEFKKRRPNSGCNSCARRRHFGVQISPVDKLLQTLRPIQFAAMKAQVFAAGK